MCRERGIEQDFTSAMSPKTSGIEERALAFIQSATMAARLQAGELCPGVEILSNDLLWAGSMNYRVDFFNKYCTAVNPGYKSSYEVWHGKSLTLKRLPFLKLGFCTQGRQNKLITKA